MGDVVIEVWFQPTCAKSADVLNILDDYPIDLRRRDVLTNAPSAEELSDAARRAGVPVTKLIDKRDPRAEQLGIADALGDDARVLSLLVRHPELLRCPILFRDQRVVWARPTLRVFEILGPSPASIGMEAPPKPHEVFDQVRQQSSGTREPPGQSGG